jgi:hypothetical protein
MMSLSFYKKNNRFRYRFPETREWFVEVLNMISIKNPESFSRSEVKGKVMRQPDWKTLNFSGIINLLIL